MKPAAGGLGLVAHPARGAWKSLQRQFNYKPTEPQRNTRVSNGVQTVKLSSSEQRQKVLEGFRVAKANVAERKKQMEKEGRRILKETKGLEPVDPEARTPVASSSAAEANAGSARSSVSQPEVTPIDEDATFLRDIDLAKRLSLAEQQGYERGVAERERRE
jgi:sterol 3beta-glucosyltransferase